MAPSLLAAWSALPFSFLIYFLLVFDSRRKDSDSAGDTQIGLKTVAAALIIVATFMFAMGFQQFLHVMLTFDEFWERLKGSLPSVLVGGLGVIGIALVLLPKTNSAEFPKAKRLAAGIIALVAGVAMLPALAQLIGALLDWPSWDVVASAFSSAVVALVIFAMAFMVLGKLSGMKMPEVKSSAPPAAQPMQAQPMQAQQPYPGQPMQGQVPGQAPVAQQQPYPGQQQMQQPQAQPQAQVPGQPPPGQGWPPQG